MNTIFIKVDDDNNVTFTHLMPFHERYGMGKTQEELLLEGKLVGEVPQPVPVEGKTGVQKYDPATNKVFIEYMDIPKTEEQTLREMVANLQAENAQINYALMMGGLI